MASSCQTDLNVFSALELLRQGLRSKLRRVFDPDDQQFQKDVYPTSFVQKSDLNRSEASDLSIIRIALILSVLSLIICGMLTTLQ